MNKLKAQSAVGSTRLLGATLPYEMIYRIERQVMGANGRMDKREGWGLCVIKAKDIESAIKTLKATLKGEVKIRGVMSAARLVPNTKVSSGDEPR